MINIYSKRLAFLDLDGTLIETKSGKTFPENENDWRLREGLVNALQAMHTYGKLQAIAIVTNQGGIEKGFVKESSFRRKLLKVADELRHAFATNVLVICRYCPFNDESCYNRKPNIGMLASALMEIDKHIPWLEAGHMIMIGDASGLPGQFSASDKKTAENFKIDYYDADTLINDFANGTFSNN